MQAPFHSQTADFVAHFLLLSRALVTQAVPDRPEGQPIRLSWGDESRELIGRLVTALEAGPLHETFSSIATSVSARIRSGKLKLGFTGDARPQVISDADGDIIILSLPVKMDHASGQTLACDFLTQLQRLPIRAAAPG